MIPAFGFPVGRPLVGRRLGALFFLFVALGSNAPAAEPSEFTIDGVKVILRPRPASSTVSAGIFFHGGRLHLTPASAGIETLLLGSAIEGTARFPRDTLRAELGRMGSTLDVRCAPDFSVLKLQATTDHFARTLEIAVDAALRPALAPDDVERVRARITAIAASDASIDRVRRRRGDQIIHRAHPYAPPSEGTPQTLAAIGIDQLRNHHRVILQKSRMLIVVVGGVTEAEVRAALADRLRALPADLPRLPPPPPLKFNAPLARLSPFDASVPRADVLFAAPPPGAPDYPALRVAASILQNRNFELVRDRLALSYDPTVDMEAYAAPHGAIRFSASSLNEVARAISGQVERLRKEPVAKTLVAAIALQLGATEFTEAQTNEAQAWRLAEYEFLRGGWRGSLAPQYESVTPEDVQKAAQQYFTNFQFIVFGGGDVWFDEKVFR